MTPRANERRLPHRAALIVLVMAGLVLLGGCDRLRPEPAAPQHSRLPERTPEHAAYDLLDALLLSPVTVELPPGYTLPPRNAVVRFDPKLTSPDTQALGGIVVLPTGPHAVNWFGYTVAATTDAAQVTFGLPAALALGRPVTDTFTPAGFDSPVECHVAAAPQSGSGGITFCRALVGTVGVFSRTESRTDPQRGSDADTVALLRAGVTHLRAVQAAEAGAAAAPPATRVMRVGLLAHSWFIPPPAFRERLAALGWVRGQNLAMVYRFYQDQPERAPALAAELVRERVDVIVANDHAAARAAKDATTTIPVVFLLYQDAVAAGMVQSYARPGGNLTGVNVPVDPSLAAKRLDLLAEAVPAIRRVGVLVGESREPTWRELEEVARAHGVELLPLVVRGLDELAGALEGGAAAGAQALLTTPTLPYNPGGNALDYITAINRFAQQRRLPLVPDHYNFTQLLSYGPSTPALWTIGATQVDRVLRGADPAQTPVEQVPVFELTINLNVAQSLGLSIAPSILARATQIVQPGQVTPTQVR